MHPINSFSFLKKNLKKKNVIFLDISDVAKGKQKILIEISGEKQICSQMVELNPSSLHASSVFILDCGTLLIQYNTKNCLRFQKAYARDLLFRIRDDRKGAAQVAEIGLNLFFEISVFLLAGRSIRKAMQL